MQRLSSSATLLLKFFIPTFWCSFFGALTIAILFSQGDFYGRISINTIRIVVAIIFLLGCLFWWKSVAGLKRIEADEEYLYATNYFKTFRYPFSSIESIEIKDFKFFKTAKVNLKEAGTFGKTMTSVISEKRFYDFMYGHPKVALQFGFKPED